MRSFVRDKFLGATCENCTWRAIGTFSSRGKEKERKQKKEREREREREGNDEERGLQGRGRRRLKEGETLSVGKVEAAEPRLDIADPWRFTIHEEAAEERRESLLEAGVPAVK